VGLCNRYAFIRVISFCPAPAGQLIIAAPNNALLRYTESR